MVNPLDSDHFDMNGNFSEDDIQHLLGVMNGSHEDSASQDVHTVGGTALQAAVEAAAAAACLNPQPSEPGVPKTDSTTHSEIDEEAKAMARSERKRSREKQRRMDVNKQFNDLTKLISQIEQEEREEDPTIFRQSFSATNRADLIARTISHVERLRDSTKRRKTECATLRQQLQDSQKAGEEMASKYKEALSKNQGMMPQQNKQVMMMVPMMMPANAAQTMPQFGMQAQAPMMNQFMMPQPFMTQHAAAPAAAAPAASQAQAPQQPAQAPQQPLQQQQQQQHAQAPAAAAQQPQQPQDVAQQGQPQAPGVQMMTPQQMMFTSMQGVFPNTMVDPNATQAAMAATPVAPPAQQAMMPQMQMPFHFQMQAAAPAPTAPVAEPAQNDGGQQQQQKQQQQHPQQPQQQPPPSNGQGNASAGGSNYAHCA